MSLDIRRQVSLQRYNSLALDAKAEYFCRLTTIQEVQQAVAFADANKLAITVLGCGSNVVLKSELAGLIVLVQLTGISHRRAGNDIYVTVGAGEDWSSLVASSLGNSWFGLENLALIPGSMGAAPIQNIGAYGVELCDRFVSLEAIHRRTGEICSMDRLDCEFGYRDSIFKNRELNNYIIIEVCIKLSTKPINNWHYPALHSALEEKLGSSTASGVTPQLIAETVTEIRRAKLPDPALWPNAGSFFKNPLLDRTQLASLVVAEPQIPVYPVAGGLSKVPAAWLIERCGLRGHRVEQVGVHSKQALVLINYGGSSGRQLLALAEHMQRAVKEKFDIYLEIEPTIYGSF